MFRIVIKLYSEKKNAREGKLVQISGSWSLPRAGQASSPQNIKTLQNIFLFKGQISSINRFLLILLIKITFPTHADVMKLNNSQKSKLNCEKE